MSAFCSLIKYVVYGGENPLNFSDLEFLHLSVGQFCSNAWHRIGA